jgi:hypothetical protein
VMPRTIAHQGLRTTGGLAFLLALGIGCGSGGTLPAQGSIGRGSAQQPPAGVNATKPDAAQAGHATPPALSPSGVRTEASSACTGAGCGSSPTVAGTDSASAFPLRDFEPMHPRTGQPGDGRWLPYPEGTPLAETAMMRSLVHPNPLKRYVFVIAIAMDLRRTELRLVAGTDEPDNKAVPNERRTGLIPEGDWTDALVVFNGGFMARHGKHGMKIGDDLFVPPRDDACTIALEKNGALRIRSWPALAANEVDMAAYRQAPPCLVEQGKLHPELPTETVHRRWGAAEDGKRDVRRSALCLDQSGTVLLYGFGDYIMATELAQGMQRAGGHDCAELDINWSYTRFFPVDHATSPPRLGESFVEKLEYSKQAYFTKPYFKDFFYLKRRR